MKDAELASLLAGCAHCPYPGAWQDSPFSERTVDGVRYALVAVDPGLSALGVRRDDRSLWYLPEDDAPHLVNSSVEAFVAFNRAYEEAAAEAAAYEGPGVGPATPRPWTWPSRPPTRSQKRCWNDSEHMMPRPSPTRTPSGTSEPRNWAMA